MCMFPLGLAVCCNKGFINLYRIHEIIIILVYTVRVRQPTPTSRSIVGAYSKHCQTECHQAQILRTWVLQQCHCRPRHRVTCCPNVGRFKRSRRRRGTLATSISRCPITLALVLIGTTHISISSQYHHIHIEYIGHFYDIAPRFCSWSSCFSAA